MFQTNLLSIMSSLNTVFTATGICHTGYVDCVLHVLLYRIVELALYSFYLVFFSYSDIFVLLFGH